MNVLLLQGAFLLVALMRRPQRNGYGCEFHVTGNQAHEKAKHSGCVEEVREENGRTSKSLGLLSEWGHLLGNLFRSLCFNGKPTSLLQPFRKSGKSFILPGLCVEQRDTSSILTVI